MKDNNTHRITLWDALLEGDKTFDYTDVIEVHFFGPKGTKQAQVLEASEAGVLVKIPNLKKGNLYGVKIVTKKGWNSFRYFYYQ